MPFPYSSPLPDHDLHRQRLCYRSMTPASSTADELEYLHRHEVFHGHLPFTGNIHHHPSPYPSTPFFKSEYAYTPVTLADIPSSMSMDVSKSEYPDDASFADQSALRSDRRIEMDQEEVDAIIRNKRKVRDPKACYACHRRKVKCDRNLPCDSCVKRDHPELCSYERPTKKRRIAVSSTLNQPDGTTSDTNEHLGNASTNVTVSKEQWESLHRELAQLKRKANVFQVGNDSEVHDSNVLVDDNAGQDSSSRSEDGNPEGVHAASAQMGTMHLGSRSLLAYMIGNKSQSTQDAARSLLEDDILPNLGLDNENTTYPFVDLWSTDSSMQDVSGLCNAIPEDSLCYEFWTSYRNLPGVIYPVVPDKPAFEEALNNMLKSRAHIVNNGLELNPNRPYDVSLPWLALLFAVFASGSQSTGRPAKERELTSQVYICCSYQALRMSNFLTHPTLETIEALLIIGNALSYNMNPGVSYILLGMTLRSAFSMGLHVWSQNFTEHENYLRLRTWWVLAWQDSHFSVSYDRPSASIMCRPEIPYTKQSSPGNRNYVESMAAVIRLTQEILRDRTMNPRSAMSWPKIQKHRDEVHSILEDAMPRVRNRSLCHTMEHNLERLALQLHCSYLISEICRPTLIEDSRSSGSSSHPPSMKSPTLSSGSRRKGSMGSANSPSTPGDPQTIANLRAECIKHLQKTVDTYIEIQSTNKFAGRSWIAIQRAISAAFLLGILPETRQEAAVIRLLINLEQCIEKSSHQDIGFIPEYISKNLNTSLMGNGRRASIVNGPRPPGEGEAPNWLRQMTKSLSALSKLNATLAVGKSGTNTAMPHQHHLVAGPNYQTPSQQSSPAIGMYNSPMVSPKGNHMNTASHAMTGVPTHSMGMQTMPQYQVSPQYSMAHHQSTMNASPLPPHASTSGMMQMSSNIGVATPDSTGSSSNNDWTFGNLTERALEYVQPGLWG